MNGFAKKIDGTGWRSVGSPDECAEDEVFTEEQPQLVIHGNAEILRQIVEIEATVTARRFREAILGADNGWMKTTDDQIAALRLLLA